MVFKLIMIFFCGMLVGIDMFTFAHGIQDQYYAYHWWETALALSLAILLGVLSCTYKS